LLAVGARSAEFAGWLYRDSAALRLAGYWHDRAVEWAQMAAERALQGYVLLKKSQAAWDERDAPRMLMLARAAIEGPWDLPSWVQAEAIQQEARAEAMLGGDITIITARLGQARDLLARAQPARAGDGSALAAHYSPSLLAMQMAICYCEAGQPAKAAEIYDEHLTAHAFSRRDYGYFSALRGIAVAASGRPDDAAAIGRESLQIAAATSSARTLTELSRLMGRLAAWPGRPAVQVFRDELAAGLSQSQ
jgi:tetratricopeptide (TPR) repeat protein